MLSRFPKQSNNGCEFAFQGNEEETYWLLRNQEGSKPRLTSTESKASILSGISLGGESGDEVGELPPRVTFHTKHDRQVSFKSRVMLNARVDVVKDKEPISDVPASSGKKSRDRTKKKKMTSPSSTVTSEAVTSEPMTSKPVTSQGNSSGSVSTTVAELHRVDSTGSGDSTVNIRI